MDYEIIDDGGIPVLIDLRKVSALSIYEKHKKVKDENPQSPTYGREIPGELRYYIKYEYNSTFVKVQSFSSKKERDNEYEKVREIRRDLFRSMLKDQEDR